MDKNKDLGLKLFVLILVLITLILLINFLKNVRNKDDIWNYSEIESATDIILKGTQTYDRTTYYILEDIIKRVLLSNENDSVDNLESEGYEYTANYDDLYSILSVDYKKYLSKKEYMDLIENFVEKFKVSTDSEYERYTYINTKNIIKSIYTLRENQYLCVLENVGKISYIGIELNTNREEYSILYIE